VTDGSPIWDEWLEILGRSEVDGTSLTTFRRWAESGTADRFGWQILAVNPEYHNREYQLKDNLILEGAVGCVDGRHADVLHRGIAFGYGRVWGAAE
jgi:hypothetical protein